MRPLKLDPKFIPARYYKAQTLAAQGDIAGARTELTAIVQQDPKNALAYVKLAQLAIQNGNENEGDGFFEQGSDGVAQGSHVAAGAGGLLSLAQGLQGMRSLPPTAR